MFLSFSRFSALTLLAFGASYGLSSAAGFGAGGGPQRFDSSVPVIGIYQDAPSTVAETPDRLHAEPAPSLVEPPRYPLGGDDWRRPTTGASERISRGASMGGGRPSGRDAPRQGGIGFGSRSSPPRSAGDAPPWWSAPSPSESGPSGRQGFSMGQTVAPREPAAPGGTGMYAPAPTLPGADWWQAGRAQGLPAGESTGMVPVPAPGWLGQQEGTSGSAPIGVAAPIGIGSAPGVQLPSSGGPPSGPWADFDRGPAYGSEPFPPGAPPGFASGEEPFRARPQSGGFGGGMGSGRPYPGRQEIAVGEGPPSGPYGPPGELPPLPQPPFPGYGELPQGFPGGMPMPPVPFGGFSMEDPWLATMERYLDLEERLERIEKLLEQIVANQNAAPRAEEPRHKD